MRQTSVLLLSFVLCRSMTSLVASSATSKRVRISENVQPGYVVADAARLLHLPSSPGNFKLLSQKPPEISFDLTKTSLRPKWFSLNKFTGVVTLRHRVDREELCGESSTCVFQLEIYAVNEQQLLNLDVEIDDVNDNKPLFPSQRIVVNVSENAVVGDVINLNKFLAVDRDIGKNSAITYSLSRSPYFEILQTNDNSATVNLQLKVVGALDYETNPTIKLTLFAEDNGVPPLKGSSELVVQVTDVNDNDPVFDKKEYKVKLFENTFPGFVVTRVSAHDKDSGVSGKIRYFLSHLNKPTVLQLLKINSVTGDVILETALDREVYDNLKILIEARDSSRTNQRVGRTWLLITVEDVNDNSPVIDINYIFTHEDNTVYVPEDIKPKTNIAYVTAKDADAGKNGKVSVDIESVDTKRRNRNLKTHLLPLFNLTKVGFLSVTGKLDREIIDCYEITLKSCDYGFPKKCYSKIISVVLLDVNDHRPSLPSSELFLSFPEDTPVRSKLTKVKAVDDDDVNQPAYYKNEKGDISPSPYGKIFYHLIDGDGTFKIDSQSGELTLARPLDREKRNKYVITVRAKDSGHGRALQSTRKIEILVTDINDNRPQFITPRFNNVTYYATIRRKHMITRVQAVDHDQGRNGTVSYSIILEDGKSQPHDQLFVMNNQSGELYLNMSSPTLNESLGLHRLSIQATDGGLNPLYSNQVVFVMITDAENLPTNGVINLKISSPPSIIFIIISCSASVLIISLIIIAFAVMWKSKRKSRSFSCAMDGHEEGEWTFGNVDRESSISDSRTILSKATSIRSGNDVHRRFSPGIIATPADQYSAGKITEQNTNQNISSQAKYSLLENSEINVDKKLPPQHRQLARMSSSHDGDSGRGDSDPDAPLNEITSEAGIKKRGIDPHSRQKRTISRHNSRCTEQCLRYGHSDTCWMPRTTFAIGASFVPSSNALAPPRSIQPHLVAPHSVQTTPHRNYNEQNNRAGASFAPYIQSWNYPANDLNAIYSDVIVNTRNQDVRYAPARTTLLRHVATNFRLGDGRKLNFSSLSNSQDYKAINTSRRGSNPAKPEIADIKRFSASVLGSAFHGSPLIRSSSADLLDSIHSRSCQEGEVNPRNSSRPKSSMGNVGMQETQEIIDDIEKLLKS